MLNDSLKTFINFPQIYIKFLIMKKILNELFMTFYCFANLSNVLFLICRLNPISNSIFDDYLDYQPMWNN